MGFVPSKADQDLWIRKNTVYNSYDHIAVFVDDIIVSSRDPKTMFAVLQHKHHCKFKTIDVPEFCNGADIYFDSALGNICLSAKTYLKNVIHKIEHLLNIPLKNYGAPMVTQDHPEIDESDFLAPEQVKLYQMLIGCAQWAVTLGRYDIQYATNTLARYAAFPREGHFKRVLRMFGYLKHHLKHRIEFDPIPPDFSNVLFLQHDWTNHHPDITSDMPDDAPLPLKGAPEIAITGYVDASFASDIVTRRSTTGALIFLNRTPIKWHSKRQNTIETSTYGAELVAARIAVELIIEFRYRCRMMGLRVTQPSTLFCDNASVIQNTTLPSSTLKKRHNSIAYHKIREAVAAGIVRIAYCQSSQNLADLLTKPVSPQDYYQLLNGFLFTRNFGTPQNPRANFDDQGELQLGNSQDSEDSNRTQHVSIMGPQRSPDDTRNESSAPELPQERDPQVSTTKSTKEPMKDH